MQYFIGIVPNEEYKMKVIGFRNKWKNNSIGEVVEPHITLKAQGGLTPDEKWISKVEEVCNQTRPFKITIDKPMFFGDQILYLNVLSKELHSLHKNIVREVAPSNDLIRKYFELENYVPHMTLAKTSYGLTKQELNNMAKLAEKELMPYPVFNVNFIRVYKESSPNKYIRHIDIPLDKRNEDIFN